KAATEKPTFARFLSARFTSPSLSHLFFWRFSKMLGDRLVGWFESLARPNPAAIQPDCTGDTHSIEISVSRRRYRYLPARNQLPRFYLGSEDARNLVNMHLRDACRHWTNHGHVSFCVRNDRP